MTKTAARLWPRAGLAVVLTGVCLAMACACIRQKSAEPVPDDEAFFLLQAWSEARDAAALRRLARRFTTPGESTGAQVRALLGEPRRAQGSASGGALWVYTAVSGETEEQVVGVFDADQVLRRWITDAALAEDGAIVVSWDEVCRLLREEAVAEVFQAHSRRVVLRMEDGLRYQTEEPEIDAVAEELRAAGQWGRIPFATE